MSYIRAAEMEKHMFDLEAKAEVWDDVAEVHLKELRQVQSNALSVARARVQRADEAMKQADMAQRRAAEGYHQAKMDFHGSHTELLAIDSIYTEAISVVASKKRKGRSEADENIQTARSSFDEACQQVMDHDAFSLERAPRSFAHTSPGLRYRHR
ncbi:hypothetical protein INS49_013908 [Diaporthe citri]|uniref:uncharacterized protein n=1 Tax=Diaporthe citri TaxID=83186 RepID=UPI001C7E7BF4|nr:uncharacterized protein INS49_013908 [Diaporthe citri]KAG6358024.1 hypothetical protein INS49_013908 [Diaporthe citri]